MACSLDTAIRLVTQAVHQDSAKNYDEAARCYREAVVSFRILCRSGKLNGKARKTVEEKCLLYESRLRKLDRHLLDKADLSQLFRDCVAFELGQQQGHHQQEEFSCVRSVSSSEELFENPFLKSGLLTIQRAKKEDARNHFRDALHFYEEGAGQLLDAVRRGRVPMQQADNVRIKCLLIHDRCELIRNYLERGTPLKVRKEYLDSFESSLETSSSDSSAGCRSPLFEEERAFLMEEVRSVKGSTHSLYPTCVEVNRSASAMSGHSDFDVSSHSRLLHKVQIENRLQGHQNDRFSSPIPLADLDLEMKLSLQSLNSKGSRPSSRGASSSGGSSFRSSMEQLCHLPRSISSASVNKDDSLLVFDEHGKLSVSCLSLGQQRDRNVSELTYMNSHLDPEVFLGDKMVSPVSAIGGVMHENDSGSDSGFSDPSTEGLLRQQGGSKTPGSPYERKMSEVDRKSPLSDIDSLDIVPSLPQPSPVLSFEEEGNKTDSPTPSTGSSSVGGRRRSGRSGSSVKVEPSLERVTVLSEETVVEQHHRAAAPEVYSPRGEGSLRRREYVPPRAMARLEEEQEDDVNKGCYYFMACLDSFWIL